MRIDGVGLSYLIIVFLIDALCRHRTGCWRSVFYASTNCDVHCWHYMKKSELEFVNSSLRPQKNYARLVGGGDEGH